MMRPSPPSVNHVHIEWAGPISIDAARRLGDGRRDYGLYQVYGAHPLYGRGALIYIGRCDRRTFSVRFTEHEPWIKGNADATNVEIYVGRLAGYSEPPNDEDWENLIRRAEAPLIYAHGPAANSSGLNVELGDEYYALHILNWGQFGQLLPEVSGARYSTIYWNRDGYQTYNTESQATL